MVTLTAWGSMSTPKMLLCKMRFLSVVVRSHSLPLALKMGRDAWAARAWIFLAHLSARCSGAPGRSRRQNRGCVAGPLLREYCPCLLCTSQPNAAKNGFTNSSLNSVSLYWLERYSFILRPKPSTSSTISRGADNLADLLLQHFIERRYENGFCWREVDRFLLSDRENRNIKIKIQKC